MNIELKDHQWTVFNCEQRFRVLAAGRRFGKTYLAMVELCRAAFSNRGRLAWYVAPTYKQAKRIAWTRLKDMTRQYWASRPNETDLRIDIRDAGTICLRGADNRDSLRGEGLDFVVLDEYASMASQAWTEVLRPALADRQGKALFIGTPLGHNHFFELYESAQKQPNWAAFQYTTEQGRNVTKEEIESASHELDERTFRQEFQASFESTGTGLVYYNFDHAKNVKPMNFDPNLPIFWALDFNVGAMSAVIGQRDGDYARVLTEIVLPNSDTEKACAEFKSQTENWVDQLHWPPLIVDVYGDATGNNRDTAASRTDWQIVDDFFKRNPRLYRQRRNISSNNPAVRDRVNSVNSRLRTHAGQHRLWIEPSCKELILDFLKVKWRTDPHGNGVTAIDKTDGRRTHLSDALGYMMEREFGWTAKFGEKSDRMIY